MTLTRRLGQWTDLALRLTDCTSLCSIALSKPIDAFATAGTVLRNVRARFFYFFLSTAITNPIAAVAWSIDDSSLYADADDDGNHALFLINISNQTVSYIASTVCGSNSSTGHTCVDQR